MNMKIKVTQEDIDVASKYVLNPTRCPVARALIRQLPWWRKWGFVSVGVETCNIGFRTKELPKHVSNFICDLLLDKKVEPIEFEI